MEKRETDSVNRIVILGGGSSGWMSASYLRARLSSDVEIVVIDSDSIGSIGVGEATVPTIKEQFFDVLGIPEKEWMPSCDATYKLGIRYENWRESRETNKTEHFYHLFGELPEIDEIPLSHYWLAKSGKTQRHEPFSKGCYPSHVLCEEVRAPFDEQHKQIAPYAYHFDAGKMASFLRSYCLERGVHYKEGEMIDANVNGMGFIESLVLRTGEVVEGDFFIDCSGFKGVLIKQLMKEPFVSFKQSLPTDRAISINTTNVDSNLIRNYTTATAMNSGWTWQTPLRERTGNGYVYSSAFVSDKDAELELRDFLQTDEPARAIAFESGRLRNSWVKNCVSIGLSSGFLEPLESTGLYFVYASLYQLLQHFPEKNMNPVFIESFNEKVAHMIDDVKDFIVMHFFTSARRDTKFWKYCSNELTLSDKLKDLLKKHDAGLPVKRSYVSHDGAYSRFHSEFERFWSNSNYQSVMCGVGRIPSHSLPLIHLNGIDCANQTFQEINMLQTTLLKKTEGHSNYLKKYRS